MAVQDSADIDRRRRLDRRVRDLKEYGGAERRRNADRRRSASDGRRISSAARPSQVLLPADGCQFLTPLCALARIESEFAYVESSDEEARHYVEAAIEKIRQGGLRRDPRSTDRRIAQLERLKGGAIYVRFGDDPGDEIEHVSMAIVPGEPIIVEFDSAAHALASRALLMRCARALGYSIVGLPVVTE
jgi:hypothetical protein